MTTARTLIRNALMDVGALIKNEQPDDDEANDALNALNNLLSSWSNFSDCIYAQAIETFPLTGAASYTIGVGQTFNTSRPTQIIDGYTTISQIDYPLDIINQETYDGIIYKANPGIPQYLTYNNAYPYGLITLYPTPVSVTSITIRSQKAITSISTLDTVLSFPEGWERALQKNLALELAPQYGQQPNASIVDAAAKSLGSIKLATVRARPVEAYPIKARGNIYNGWSV